MSTSDADLEQLQKIQEHFHQLIRKRATEEFGLDISNLELPILTMDLLGQQGDQRPWFPVPGMYGGFAYNLKKEEKGLKLLTESWCRVCGGSEQSHEITIDGTVKVKRR
jgi:hypothetical protein